MQMYVGLCVRVHGVMKQVSKIAADPGSDLCGWIGDAFRQTVELNAAHATGGTQHCISRHITYQTTHPQRRLHMKPCHALTAIIAVYIYLIDPFHVKEC